MSKHEQQGIDAILAEVADEAEAAERTTEPDAPLPAHVTVSRPGRARSKVLQVRLNPDEMAGLAAIAESRGLPVSTVVREQILDLLSDDETVKHLTYPLIYGIDSQQVISVVKRLRRNSIRQRSAAREPISA